MINEYILNNNLNNISDILSFQKNDRFNELIDAIDKNKKIKVNSHLIHKCNYLDGVHQFLFNLDNYITFVKDNLNINQLEIRYIIELTLYNKNNKILLSDKYYYDNIDYYTNNFIQMFMYNYKKNIIFLKKYIEIDLLSFSELVNIINNNKKRSYVFFEIINKKNMNFYLPIIENLLKSN